MVPFPLINSTVERSCSLVKRFFWFMIAMMILNSLGKGAFMILVSECRVEDGSC